MQPRHKPFSVHIGNLIPGVLLALVMCAAVVYSLAISGWAPGLDLLLPMSLPGFFLGLILARIRSMPGWLAHLLSLLLALVWAVHLLGSQMNPLLDTWRDQGTELLIRTIIWARVLLGGGRGEDLLLFVAALSLLSWSLLYDTAWQIFRHGHVWRMVTLNAVVILINYTYVLPKPDQPFFVFLAAALLLLVYQHIMQRQVQWDAQHMEYPDLLPLRFLISATLICGLLIVLTAMLPGNITVDRATRTWTALSFPFKLARERWEDAFANLSAPPGAGSGAFAARTAQLGGARRLNDNLVMTVHATSFDYWRVVAFDTYRDGGWQNTTGEQARAALGLDTPEAARSPFVANGLIPLEDSGGRQAILQTFTLAQDRPDDLLFVGGSAQSFSLPILLEHNYVRTAGLPLPNYDDVALIASPDALRAGTTYTVTALVSRIDVQSLGTAGSDYPDWVRERYLQLPDSVTARTRELAIQLVTAAGADTPYDQAIAIQDYLRTLRYNESIPSPPIGGEAVDWFLFTQREGYCDYFASSMVVMLRSLGVPARWVQGYAGGTFNPETGLYEVRERVAHSWPEVYFPGIGWERFEPTAASYTAPPLRPLTATFGSDSELEPLDEGLQPDTSNPTDLGDTQQELEPDITLLPTPLPAPLPQPRTFSPIIGGMLGLLGLLLLIYARWRYELRGLSRAAAAYAAMSLLAAWGGNAQSAHTTPQEYAAHLAHALPDHQATIYQIVAAYQTERYHRRQAPLPAPKAERALWFQLVRQIFIGIGARLPYRQ